MSDPLIKTVELQKYFKVNGGLLHAVDGVNLDIYPGKTVGLVGESGCGKSTLGRLILRLIEPTGGNVYYKGKDILQFSRPEMRNMRTKMQIIFQDPYASLDPRKTVFELISEPLIANHLCKTTQELEQKVFGLMETVGLAERFVSSYPHEMDGGRRQRVGVARALAPDPEFIVCDEPVSALDVSIQAQILNLLMDLQEDRNLAYLFITHDLSVVKHISNEIAVMYLGQCVERAPTDELFENPLHPYTKALLNAIPKITLDRKQQFKVVRGEVSDPINPAPGCRFAGRCDHFCNSCHGHDFPLKDVGNNHYVACHLFE